MKRKGWTHAICTKCWNERNPDRLTSVSATNTDEPCCYCAGPTGGIYVRASPEEVPLCQGHEESE